MEEEEDGSFAKRPLENCKTMLIEVFWFKNVISFAFQI
jgi:hypothetical protein